MSRWKNLSLTGSTMNWINQHSLSILIFCVFVFTKYEFCAYLAWFILANSVLKKISRQFNFAKLTKVCMWKLVEMLIKMGYFCWPQHKYLIKDDFMENPGKPGGSAIYQKSYYIAHHISFVRTEGVFRLLWETYVVKSCMKKIHLRVGFLQICGWCSQCVCV